MYKNSQNNKEYCRQWHSKNRERSRQLAKEYYQRQTIPIQPLESQQTVNKILKRFPKHYLLNKELYKWNKRDWKKFYKIKQDYDYKERVKRRTKTVAFK